MTPRSRAARVHRADEPDGIGTQFEDWESGAWLQIGGPRFQRREKAKRAHVMWARFCLLPSAYCLLVF